MQYFKLQTTSCIFFQMKHWLDMAVLGEGRRRVWLLRLTICYKLNTDDASVTAWSSTQFWLQRLLHPRSRGVDIMHIDSIRFESVSKTQTYNAQICDLNRKQWLALASANQLLGNKDFGNKLVLSIQYVVTSYPQTNHKQISTDLRVVV